MNLKKWLLTKIEDIKNKEMSSKNIETIIQTRLDKLSYLKNISNLLLTSPNNLSKIDIEKLKDTISKYNNYKIPKEEIENLTNKTQLGTLDNNEQKIYNILLNQVLISIKHIQDDINNLTKDKEILSTKYNINKYIKLLNKLDNKTELIKEYDILEEMLNDNRINSEDKLSNMEYVLNYNESIIN